MKCEILAAQLAASLLRTESGFNLNRILRFTTDFETSVFFKLLGRFLQQFVNRQLFLQMKELHCAITANRAKKVTIPTDRIEDLKQKTYK